MELLSSSSPYLLPISGFLLSLLLLYKLIIPIRYPKSKTPPNLPPEPPGGLPIIGHLLHFAISRKTLARTFADMADRHGPVFSVRLGVHRVAVVSDAATIQECFTAQDRALASRPKSSQAEHLTYNYAGFAAAPYGSYWRDVRKVAVTQLLSAHRLKSLRHVQVSEIGMLMKELYLLCLQGNDEPENRGGGSVVVVVISELFQQLTSNSITRLIAGKRSFDYRGNNGEDGERIGELLKEFMRVCGEFVPSDMLPFMRWTNWLPGPVKSMKRNARELDAVMQSWVEEHKLKKIRPANNPEGITSNEHHDFTDVMLSQIDEDFCQEHSPETVIKATATTLILGSAETTSVTMTWILSNLLNNRRAMELARQELDSKVGRARLVEPSDIGKLVYVQAIVKETLRLYPAAPVGVPHEAIRDCNVGGYHVPKGTHVFTNLWKLHRDPNVWSDPDEFKPERFIICDGDDDDKSCVDVDNYHNSSFGQNNFEFMPFGAGRRSCPGMGLALQVLNLTLARLLQGFTITTPAGEEAVDMGEGLGFTLPKATPLKVRIAPRLLPHLYES